MVHFKECILEPNNLWKLGKVCASLSFYILTMILNFHIKKSVLEKVLEVLNRPGKIQKLHEGNLSLLQAKNKHLPNIKRGQQHQGYQTKIQKETQAENLVF
jgi:hypothetical protein